MHNFSKDLPLDGRAFSLSLTKRVPNSRCFLILRLSFRSSGTPAKEARLLGRSSGRSVFSLEKEGSHSFSVLLPDRRNAFFFRDPLIRRRKHKRR